MNFIQRHFWRKQINAGDTVIVKLNRYEAFKAVIIFPLLNNYAYIKTVKNAYKAIHRNKIYPYEKVCEAEKIRSSGY